MASAADEREDLCALVTEPILLDALTERVCTGAAGAVVLFSGIVRDHHEGRRVESLRYEAYAPMAEAEMRRIAREVRARWPLKGVAIVHRTGRLRVGETSVAVAVSAAHRREALEACSHAVDRLKESVPIWKKEYGEAGAGWIFGDRPPNPTVHVRPPRRGPSFRRRADA